MKKIPLSILSALALVSLNGCLIDNQKIVSVWDAPLANPAPSPRNFAGNNAKHKILLGVIDTGVDYNHPLLADNIHFDLDANGKPTGLGSDLIGDDAFPSPYIARTSVYDPTIKGDDAVNAGKSRSFMRALVGYEPSLSTFLEPNRNSSQEYSEGAYHGTHVAGLMVYDRPDFGLRAYRLLPSARGEDDSKRDMTTESVEQIIQAIDLAAKDGVKIVNMSLGLDFQKAVKPEDEDTAEYEKLSKLFDQLTAAVQRHPDVLFVAAAGNEGVWKDGANKLGLPCGVKAPNVLCVGALRENGDPTTFTSFPIGGVDLVFALGQKVLSTVPTQMCMSPVMKDIHQAAAMGGDYSRDMAKLAATSCAKETGLSELSGTSMASPIVAHAAAEILAADPSLAPAAIIKAIYRRSAPSFIGTVPVYKLRIVKPSWYSKQPGAPLPGKRNQAFASGDRALNDRAMDESGYWEGFVPAEKSQ